MSGQSDIPTLVSGGSCLLPFALADFRSMTGLGYEGSVFVDHCPRARPPSLLGEEDGWWVPLMISGPLFICEKGLLASGYSDWSLDKAF